MTPEAGDSHPVPPSEPDAPGSDPSPAPPGLKIGELMRLAGVTRATIHHYLKEELLPPPVVSGRNMALYAPDCVDRILLIKELQQHHRRSLSEVKGILRGAADARGLERLRRLLDVEASRAQASLIPDSSPREPLTRSELARRTGFSESEIRAFEGLGLVTARGRPARLDPADVDVLDALAHLRDAGFDAGHGFGPADVVMYTDALRSLLHKEIALFLERAVAGEDPSRFQALAEQGIERVTPLLLALRRKLIRELLDVADPAVDGPPERAARGS